MSLICHLHDMLTKNLYAQTGYRILTNSEYNEEIKFTIKEIIKLRRKNLIDNESFSYLTEICISKLIENSLDVMFSLDPNRRKWLVRSHNPNEESKRE